MLRKEEGKILKSITDFMGEGVQITENPKSLERKEEEFFCNLLEAITTLDERTLQLLEIGIDLTLYEDPLHHIIEGLIYKYYGQVKAQIIMWWVLSYPEKEKGKNLTLRLNDGKEHIINTPKQLYRVLKKIKI